MKIETHSIPFFVVRVPNHSFIKPIILQNISSMGIHSKIELPDESIGNTDWHLSSNIARPYFDITAPVFENAVLQVEQALNLRKSLVNTSYWFQQYNKGDFHNWHHHGPAMISAVYYLELDDSPKTTYRCMGEEFTIDVSEGDILFAPGFFEHTSKENKGKRKTVIVQNYASSY